MRTSPLRNLLPCQPPQDALGLKAVIRIFLGLFRCGCCPGGHQAQGLPEPGCCGSHPAGCGMASTTHMCVLMPADELMRSLGTLLVPQNFKA